EVGGPESKGQSVDRRPVARQRIGVGARSQPGFPAAAEGCVERPGARRDVRLVQVRRDLAMLPFVRWKRRIVATIRLDEARDDDGDVMSVAPREPRFEL